MIVIIDDERTFSTLLSHDIVHLRSSDEAVAWLGKWWSDNWSRPLGSETVVIDELWFDHDLGGEDTAVPVARYLNTLAHHVDRLPIGRILIHSQNPVGSKNLWGWLSGVGLSCARVPLDARGCLAFHNP